MIQRSLLLFGGLFLLFVALAVVLRGEFTMLLLVQSFAYALIALGLNIQWGYGGLFNFGIMGFLMLGGFAVTFVSYQYNPAFWESEGPMLLARAILAFAGGMLLVLGARHAHRVGITGRWKTALTVLAWAVQGPFYPTAYVAKTIELTLIALLVIDFVRVDGNPVAAIRRAMGGLLTV